MVDRREVLKLAAVVAGVAAGDVSQDEVYDQSERLVELAHRDEDERWSYPTESNFAHVRSGLFDIELDSIATPPAGKVETWCCSGGQIPLAFEVTSEEHGSIGTLVNLTADQAEELAVDLLEQAHAARRDDEHAAPDTSVEEWAGTVLMESADGD